jgi:hypothetical protein
MKFEYHSFAVEPYLDKKLQPTFVLKDLNASSKYHTVSSMDPVTFSVVKPGGINAGLNLRVFPIASANREEHDEDERNLSSGSILFALGLESALKVLSELKLNGTVSKVVIVLATNCHELEGGRCRAYFGIAIEEQK